MQSQKDSRFRHGGGFGGTVTAERTLEVVTATADARSVQKVVDSDF